jgi:cytosine deaminase
MSDDETFMLQALLEAKKSLYAGGIPIGSVLVKDGKIIGRGHNKLIQNYSVILHGEMDCIENAGRILGKHYQKSTLYTTLAPCPMCCGVILLHKIPRVVIGENTNLKGSEDLLRKNGVEVVNLSMPECKTVLADFIAKNPDLWDLELERVGYSTKIK